MYKLKSLQGTYDNALIENVLYSLHRIGVSHFDAISILEIGNYRNKEIESDTDLLVVLRNDYRYKGVEVFEKNRLRIQIQLTTYESLESLSSYKHSWDDLTFIYQLIEGRIILNTSSRLPKVLKAIRALFQDDGWYFGLIFSRVNQCVEAINKYESRDFNASRNALKAYIIHEVIVSCLALKRYVYQGPTKAENLLDHPEFSELRKFINSTNLCSDSKFIQMSNSVLVGYGSEKLIQMGKNLVGKIKID